MLEFLQAPRGGQRQEGGTLPPIQMSSESSLQSLAAEERQQEVTVVFRQGTSLLIPPTGLPREPRLETETFEKAALRLSLEHGINGSVDHMLPRPDGLPDDLSLFAYLIEPSYGELASSELLIAHETVDYHLDAHVRLNTIDAQLIKSAHRLIAARFH